MPRPKKNDNKIYMKVVRYSEAEYKVLQKKVERTPYTASEYIRRCTLGKKIATTEIGLLDIRIRRIANELSKLGGWTKNFYNETNGLEKDLTRKILANIEHSTAEIYKNLCAEEE